MIGKLFDKLLNYLQLKLDVLKLSVIERVAIVIGFCMLMMLGMIVVLSIFLFLGIGLSILLGEWIGSTAAGYFITTVIFIILLSIILLVKKKLLKWFSGLFVSLLTNHAEHHDHNDKNSDV